MEDGEKLSENEEQQTISSDDDQEDERTEIRKELSNMSFADIQKLKDKLGAKVFNEAYHGRPLRRAPQRGRMVHGGRGGAAAPAEKRRGRHAPLEQSSKARVSDVTQVVTVPKVVRRDPRFDGLSGTFDPAAFEKNFQFVDELRASERAQLRRQWRDATDPAEKRQLKLLLQRMQNQEQTRQQRRQREQQCTEARRQNIARLRQGQRPVYKAQSVRRREQLAEKFLQLRSSGALDSYMQKRRRKLAAKSKKSLPTS